MNSNSGIEDFPESLFHHRVDLFLNIKFEYRDKNCKSKELQLSCNNAGFPGTGSGFRLNPGKLFTKILKPMTSWESHDRTRIPVPRSALFFK